MRATQPMTDADIRPALRRRLLAPHKGDADTVLLEECVFRGSWPPIPREAGRGFHVKPATVPGTPTTRTSELRH